MADYSAQVAVGARRRVPLEGVQQAPRRPRPLPQQQRVQDANQSVCVWVGGEPQEVKGISRGAGRGGRGDGRHQQQPQEGQGGSGGGEGGGGGGEGTRARGGGGGGGGGSGGEKEGGGGRGGGEVRQVYVRALRVHIAFSRANDYCRWYCC